jgi:sugar phosphate isomerase/epimerase
MEAGMSVRIARRTFLAGCTAGFALPAPDLAERIGIMCQLEPEEAGARKALAAAREAGFRRAQITFPWDRAGGDFLRGLPGWIAAEDLRAEVLGAYVNCAAPGVVLMSARAEDFDRAIDYAARIGARHLTAWTGGYGPGLMTSDARNFTPEASDAIRRFLEPRLERLADRHLTLALETYITLACPDAPSLRRLLDKLPPVVGAVLDPPNMTPVERYGERDGVMREMFRALEGRVGVVHMKDFRLAKDGRSYELPGPLAGEMNYRLFLEQIRRLPDDTPLIAEHLNPGEFREARKKLVAACRGAFSGS